VLGLGRLELIEQEKAIPACCARSMSWPLGRPASCGDRNQFSKLDHDHLTRGLAYAVAVQATSLVLIAEDHQGEFRAVARYLNELAVRSEAPQQIGVYLVTVGVERLEEYLIPRVSVVESPNPLREEPKVSAAPRPYVAGLEEFLSRVTPQAVQEQPSCAAGGSPLAAPCGSAASPSPSTASTPPRPPRCSPTWCCTRRARVG